MRRRRRSKRGRGEEQHKVDAVHFISHGFYISCSKLFLKQLYPFFSWSTRGFQEASVILVYFKPKRKEKGELKRECALV